MANDIARALDQAQMGGKERLKGSTATVNFQASAQRADVGSNGFSDAMASFVKAGTNAYGTYAENNAKDAQAKSDKIIRTMTRDQRAAAIANGTLLAQDDPDVMNILRHDTGRSAAFEIENEMQTKIASGEFDQKDRKDLEEYRQTRLNMVAESYAKEAGIDPSDPEYQRGFNADIVQRNAGIFDLHEQRRSKRFIAQSVINTRGDIGGLLDDPAFMRSLDSGAQMASYFEDKSSKMGFPTDSSLVEALNLTVSDAVNKEHGPAFLSSFGEQEVTVLGVKQKVKDIVGQDKYDNLIVKASGAAYQRNRPRFEKFQVDLATAENQTDPVMASNMLDKIDAANQWLQDTPDMTPQKQALINARINLQTRLKADSARTLKGTQEAMQTDNRLFRLDESYTKRMNGEYLDLSKKGMPVDANTGEFKESDWATFANMKLNQISAMGIPEDQKDALRGKLISADFDGGPFRAAFKTLIDDATNEWTGAVSSGEQGEFKAITQLQRVYAQQPGMIAALYPDKAGFIEKMNQMSSSGIDPSVLIEADRKNATLSPEERKNRDIQWDALKRDAANPQLSAIPNDMETMARSLYDGFLAGTGDASDASKRLSVWLEKNTVSFQDDDDEAQPGYRGMLNKKDLMADPNDANSWEAGKRIVDETVKGIKAASPYWAEAPVKIEKTKAGDITITSLTGQRIKLTQQSLQLIYKAERQAAMEKSMTDTVNKAQINQGLYKDFIQGGKGPL
jgi:hypothetical protein